MCVHALAVKYQVYLTGKSVVDPPYFFANQFGDGVASVVGKSLHKVLHGEEKSQSIVVEEIFRFFTHVKISIQLPNNTPLQVKVSHSK